MSGCIPGVILRAWQQDLQDNGFRKDRVCVPRGAGCRQNVIVAVVL